MRAPRSLEVDAGGSNTEPLRLADEQAPAIFTSQPARKSGKRRASKADGSRHEAPPCPYDRG